MVIKGLELFNIGDKIEITRINTKDKTLYPSQILDILDEDILVVSGPIYQKQLVYLHKNEKIRVSYVLKNRGHYSFDAIILNRKLTNIYRLKLKRISEIRKMQLREFYRFNISIPIAKYFTIKDSSGEKTLSEKCETKDISGSGLKISSNFKHNVGDIIICEFYIDSYLINAKAEVIRIENIDAFNYKYVMGIQFIDLNEVDRDRIVKFIFSKQRVLREKGLI